MQLLAISPFLAHKERRSSPTVLVLHATAGGTARSSIDYLRKKGLSYHYVISRDAKDSAHSMKAEKSVPIVFCCVPEGKQAFHVASTIPSPCGAGGINRCSIGISLANSQNQASVEPYAEGQLETLNDLISDILKRHQIRWITGHKDCQPWNRADPYLFEVSKIAKRHALEYWVPSSELIRQHTPPKTKIA